MLERTQVQLVSKTCSSGHAYEAMPWWDRCPTCAQLVLDAQLERWKASTNASIATLEEEVAIAIGMAPVDRVVVRERVPAAIKKALPRSPVEALLAGRVHLEGFGLVGAAGVGKTACAAVLVRAYIAAVIAEALAGLQDVPSGDQARSWYRVVNAAWCNWPAVAEQVKTASTGRDGALEVERLARRAQHADVLVLDDLGRERMRGPYGEDFAFGVLDRIVDFRSRHRKPILWTSNLGRAGLIAQYGAAFTSRLYGLAPAVELPALPDLRAVAP